MDDRSDPTPLLDLTVYLLSQVGRMGKQTLDAELAERGLRLRHMAVLAALADEGAAGQLTLARYLRLDPSDITTTLDDLQRRRLVDRAVDPTDRRRRLVSLTVEGQTVLQGLCDLAREVADGLLAPLDDTRRDVLHSALLTVLVAARGTTREPERFGRPAPVADNRR
jgi:DNA-binding MarR family transcriptional regulator